MFDGETVEPSDLTDIAEKLYKREMHLALLERLQAVGEADFVTIEDIEACITMPQPLGPPPKPARRSTRH